MSHFLLAAVFVLGLAAPAAAGYWDDFDAAVQAYADGDYDAARRGFEPLAKRGDHRSQYWLGIMYFEGEGVPQDRVRAYMWLSLAAEQGNRGARAGRDGIAHRMSKDQIAAAKALAAAWSPAD
ncbi:MAG: tetratricopeptide repeat protein [Alphaproteobacteria bacterium]